MLCSGHNPFDARVFYKEALSLRKVYEDITILAPYHKEEIRLGVRIIGLKARRYWWDRLGPLIQMYKRGLAVEADVYHCHEADSLLVGYLIKKRLGCKLVYDSHELHSVQFPQHFAAPLRKLVEVLIRRYEKWLLGGVDYVITVNQIIRSYFALLKPSVKVQILYNCPIISLFEESKEHSEPLVICHEGHLNFARGLREMVHVLTSLKTRYSKIKLLIVGDVYDSEREWLDSQITRFHLEDNVEITGWLPYEDVGKAIRRAQIGLIFFKPLPNNMLAGPPNKLFNYMRYGLPVVAPDFPEMRRIIVESNCGVLVDSNDVKGFINAIDRLLCCSEKAVQMGRRGEKAVLRKYNWEQMEQRLHMVYEILEQNSRGG
jgi:glycosyltransferase involved in cell wall biosynthesis